MWLTGFDAPCLHTMYVDKPMRGHNLMQAIARVNRVFKDKPGGLVVDYIGIANELKAALADYTQAKGRGKPTIDAHEALAVLQEQMDVLHAMLHGLDYDDFRSNAWKRLPLVANHVLGQDDGKKRFADAVLAATKAFALCCTLDQALVHRDELAFLQAVKAALTKHGGADKKLTDEQKEHARSRQRRGGGHLLRGGAQAPGHRRAVRRVPGGRAPHEGAQPGGRAAGAAAQGRNQVTVQDQRRAEREVL
jgi:type I restriction enzyme R subunit